MLKFLATTYLNMGVGGGSTIQERPQWLQIYLKDNSFFWSITKQDGNNF